MHGNESHASGEIRQRGVWVKAFWPYKWYKSRSTLRVGPENFTELERSFSTPIRNKYLDRTTKYVGIYRIRELSFAVFLATVFYRRMLFIVIGYFCSSCDLISSIAISILFQLIRIRWIWFLKAIYILIVFLYSRNHAKLNSCILITL